MVAEIILGALVVDHALKHIARDSYISDKLKKWRDEAKEKAKKRD